MSASSKAKSKARAKAKGKAKGKAKAKGTPKAKWRAKSDAECYSDIVPAGADGGTSQINPLSTTWDFTFVVSSG